MELRGCLAEAACTISLLNPEFADFRSSLGVEMKCLQSSLERVRSYKWTSNTQRDPVLAASLTVLTALLLVLHVHVYIMPTYMIFGA